MCSLMDIEWKLSVCLSNKGLGEGYNHGEREEGHTNYYWENSVLVTFQKEKEFPFSIKELQSPESQLVKLIKSPLWTLKLLQLSVVLNPDRLSRYRHATIQGFCFIMLLTRLLGLCKNHWLSLYTVIPMEQRLSTLPSEMCYYLYLQGFDDTVTHEVQSITTPEDGASQRLRSESPSCHLNCMPSSLLHYLSCFPKAWENLQT